jgi:hypothetical protein
MSFKREVEGGVGRLFIDGILRLETTDVSNPVIEGLVRRAEEKGIDSKEAEMAVIHLGPTGYVRHQDGVWRKIGPPVARQM